MTNKHVILIIVAALLAGYSLHVDKIDKALPIIMTIIVGAYGHAKSDKQTERKDT